LDHKYDSAKEDTKQKQDETQLLHHKSYEEELQELMKKKPD
jgi:hypothetical protein